MKELKELGLGIVYLGVETGNDDLLQATHKGTTYEKTVEAGRRIKAAGINLSAMILLGIGGVVSPFSLSFEFWALVELCKDLLRAISIVFSSIQPGSNRRPLHGGSAAPRNAG